MTANESPIIEGLLGQNVFVRCVTFHYTGRLVSADGLMLHLEDAAWIASSGRFSTALATGHLHEVEPFPDGVFIAVAAIVDMSIWRHDLPRKPK